MKKLQIQMNGRTDKFQTPKIAIAPLLPFLKKEWVIWECAWGGGLLAEHLKEENFQVIGNTNNDFFDENPEFNCVVTNPPNS